MMNVFVLFFDWVFFFCWWISDIWRSVAKGVQDIEFRISRSFQSFWKLFFQWYVFKRAWKSVANNVSFIFLLLKLTRLYFCNYSLHLNVDLRFFFHFIKNFTLRLCFFATILTTYTIAVGDGVNLKNCVLLGAINTYFGASRSIHGSGLNSYKLCVLFCYSLSRMEKLF